MTADAKKRIPKCHRCGKPFERRIAPPYLERMKYDGGRHEVLVEGMPRWQCDACSITVTDDDSDTVVQDCLRRHIGLLTADEIREARMTLGLTQAQLAELIGCAAESLSRWENGAILQSRTNDRLLRLVGPDAMVGRVAVPGPRDPKPEFVESMRILTRIWQGAGNHMPSQKVTPPRTEPVPGSVGEVWLEAQRRSSADRATWGGMSASSNRRADAARADWEPS